MENATLIGHYPTDPTSAIGDIRRYLQTGDTRLLLHGLYDLSGYVLGITYGELEATPQVDPQIIAESIQLLHNDMQTSTAELSPWAKTLLQIGMHTLMAWLQGKVTIQAQMFKMKHPIEQIGAQPAPVQTAPVQPAQPAPAQSVPAPGIPKEQK